jgi:hypothetical protein
MGDFYSIQATEGGYWQCGQWVSRPIDATKYPTEDEAHSVIAMCQLNNASVIANNTPWRDLRPQVKE